MSLNTTMLMGFSVYLPTSLGITLIGLSVEMSMSPKDIRRSLLQIPACIAGEPSCTSSSLAKGIRITGDDLSSLVDEFAAGIAGMDSTDDSECRRVTSASIFFIKAR